MVSCLRRVLICSSSTRFVLYRCFHQDCSSGGNRFTRGTSTTTVISSLPRLMFHFQRGMTIAPRVQVYTQLSCNALYPPQHYGSLLSNPSLSPTHVPEYIASAFSPVYFPHFSNFQEHNGAVVPRKLHSKDCLSDPAVQAGAARLQAIMTTIMGILSVCSTTWWGHYGEKHGRTKVLAASTLGLLTTYTPSFIPFPPTLSHVHSQ